MNQRRCAELRDVPGCPDLATIFRIADVPVGMGAPSGWVAVGADVLPMTHYWSHTAGAPVPFPPWPGQGHAFDFSGAWSGCQTRPSCGATCVRGGTSSCARAIGGCCLTRPRRPTCDRPGWTTGRRCAM